MAVIVPMIVTPHPAVALLLAQRPDERTASLVSVFVAKWCTGVRPSWPTCNYWEDAKQVALNELIAGEQYDAHMQALDSFFWARSMERQAERRELQERYS